MCKQDSEGMDVFWVLLPAVLVALLGFASAGVYYKLEADVKMEAIKAGLHQEVVDGIPVWVKGE